MTSGNVATLRTPVHGHRAGPSRRGVPRVTRVTPGGAGSDYTIGRARPGESSAAFPLTKRVHHGSRHERVGDQTGRSAARRGGAAAAPHRPDAPRHRRVRRRRGLHPQARRRAAGARPEQPVRAVLRQRRATGPVRPPSQCARGGGACARQAALGPGGGAPRGTTGAGRRAVPPQVQHPGRGAVPHRGPAARHRVLDVPGVLPDRGRPANRVYNEWSIPLFCRRAVRVLTNSDSLARELEQVAGVPRTRWPRSTPPPTSDLPGSPIRTSLAACDASTDLPDRPFFLMVVKGYARIEYAGARSVPRKNVEGTLEAASRGPGPTTRHAADGDPWRGGARRLDAGGPARPVRALPTRSSFPASSRTTTCPPSTAWRARCCSRPYYESFGIPLVEAMACGCPVITSSAPACPEVVGDAALIVDPDDVDGLAEAMLRLACEPGLAGALRARGLIRAAEFSWHEGAGRLLGRAHASGAGRLSLGAARARSACDRAATA